MQDRQVIILSISEKSLLDKISTMDTRQLDKDELRKAYQKDPVALKNIINYLYQLGTNDWLTEELAMIVATQETAVEDEERQAEEQALKKAIDISLKEEKEREDKVKCHHLPQVKEEVKPRTIELIKDEMLDLFEDPDTMEPISAESAVITPQGTTYAESSIKAWINKNAIDPRDRSSLTKDMLRENKIFSDLKNFYMAKILPVTEFAPCTFDKTSKNLFINPIVTVEGNTYEKSDKVDGYPNRLVSSIIGLVREAQSLILKNTIVEEKKPSQVDDFFIVDLGDGEKLKVKENKVKFVFFKSNFKCDYDKVHVNKYIKKLKNYIAARLDQSSNMPESHLIDIQAAQILKAVLENNATYESLINSDCVSALTSNQWPLLNKMAAPMLELLDKVSKPEIKSRHRP